MKAFPGIMRYAPITDSSSSDTRVQATPEYELQDQKIPVTSPSPPFDVDEREDDESLHKPSKNYSRISSSKLPEPSLPPEGRHDKVDTGFSPLFTRRWILLCFAILWVLIIISLQIIYTVSEKQEGLATPNPKLRLIWTYGPTAILVIVTVLWRQVDYAGMSLLDISCSPQKPFAN